MYYEGADGHGLPFDPFKAIIAPRPIGWISTVDEKGRPNLSPYSFFSAMSTRPHMIAFSSEGMKHTPRNAIATGEFVFNLVTLPQLEAMNLSSAKLADGESEFDFADLEMLQSKLVRAPRVAGSPVSIECRVVHSQELHDVDGKQTDQHFVVGQVMATHINDNFVVDGRFDIVRAQTVARCGYRDYSSVSSVLELKRPDSG
ncbi:flavin reductase family protein [Allorhizobium pseudoryzae]|uniref:flavin reductase family protein n=1 Tax=Allorhizobium pseudoryzae TaxID=379684 RepID=UPI003D01EEA7